MCLGIPGRVVEIDGSNPELLMGKVSFGGLAKEVCLAYTPDVSLGDYVLVHAGFAINRLDEDHAAELFRYLAEMDELAGLGDAPPHESGSPPAQASPTGSASSAGPESETP